MSSIIQKVVYVQFKIKIVNSICLKSESSTKWNKIPTRASILIILTYPKHMKYYIHSVGYT